MFEGAARTRRHESVHIDVVPMVDCMLVLVIFLVVSSVFVHDPGIEVERPEVSGAGSPMQNAMLVAISADDRIFFDGQEVRAEQIGPALKQAALDPGAPLIIRADRHASHGMFAHVHAEAKAAGIGTVLFATALATE